MWHRILLPSVGAAFLAACGGQPARPVDPLVDHIFTTADRHELTRRQLFALLAKADVVYLGESHDNARHHELQREVLRALVGLGKRPAVGFEVFSVDQTSLLMSYVKGKAGGRGARDRQSGEQRLRQRLGWEDPARDQSWAFYGPLLKLAREHDLTVFGADLPRATRARITRVGVGGLTRVERSLLHPSGFEHDAYEALMRDKLKRMHCGFGSPDYLGRLYDNWVARNDAMAAAISGTLAEQPGEPVVVILGAGHVQHNMGVFERVAHRNPRVSQINLALREVEPRPEPLDHYVAPLTFAGTRFAPDHEYLWFTPRTPDSGDDPCAVFRERMKKRQG